MTIEELQKRFVDLLNQKSQLEQQSKQIEQQVYMLIGHMNEVQHQIQVVSAAQSSPAPVDVAPTTEETQE